MRKMLIVIHCLDCGGAEKSLISFLENMPQDEWKVDLLIADYSGMFISAIPSFVHVIRDQFEFENYATPLRKRRRKVCSAQDLYCQIKWQIGKHICYKNLTRGEQRWKIWGKSLPVLNEQYDLAVSYMNGYPNYYVIDKVQAKKKVIWVHNEFRKLGYNIDFERPYFEKADAIVTISESCASSISEIFPEFQKKTLVLENITAPATVERMAAQPGAEEYDDATGLKLLSIGRLSQQKGFDIALEAAEIMKNAGVDFRWVFLGQGEMKTELQNMILEKKLEKNCILAGVRENPYVYIQKCDVFVQPSRYEGKSIVLDEAKILNKPIVVTNYTTVVNSIRDKVNGLIVAIDKKAIANGIIYLAENSELKECLTNNLKNEKKGNVDEITKYMELFNSLYESFE